MRSYPVVVRGAVYSNEDDRVVHAAGSRRLWTEGSWVFNVEVQGGTGLQLEA